MAVVLVADDDERVRRLLNRALVGAGHRVLEAADAVAVRKQLQDKEIDLILLDLVMPGEDGLSVLRSLPADGPPVMVLSGVAEVSARITAIDAGAVDFVVKPFAVGEILARVNRHLHLAGRPSGTSSDIAVGQLTMHPGRRSVTAPQGEIELSGLEFALLAHLARRPGETSTKAELLRDVWQTDWESGSNAIEVCVARLRSKLDPYCPIRTVRGLGYYVDVG